MLSQTTARAWLTAAPLSLALPLRWRQGLWRPPHLMLAGAISTATSGAMRTFVIALVKAWLFPMMGRGPVLTDHARAVWGK